MSVKCVAVLAIFCLGASVAAADLSGFSFKTGVGYDFLSQRYFLDSLSRAGSDSILTKWALTTDYLDDFKGNISLRYRYDEARRVDLRTSYEQTPELLRLKFSGDWQEETIFGTLQWRNEIDWRDQYRQTDRIVGSYVYGLTQLKLKYPLTMSTHSWAQAQLDGVNFYGQRTLGFDHYRFGGKVGLERTFGLLSMASLDVFALNRQVADSTNLDYSSFGAEGSFMGLLGQTDLDFMARYEHKDYRRADQTEDYDRFEAEGRNRITMGKNFVSRQEVQLELSWFNPLDLLNLNYQRLSMTVLGGMQHDGVEIGIGPDFEVLTEQSPDTSLREDYYEMGGKLDASYLSGNGLFGSVDSELGYRHLGYQTEIQSNFVYYRLNLIADWSFLHMLNFNTLLSSEWEWHDQAGNDSRVVLLSTSLSYSF